MTVSDWQVNGVPVIEATATVLCPDCLGDWCPSCGWTGMFLPARPAAIVLQLPTRQPELIGTCAA